MYVIFAVSIEIHSFAEFYSGSDSIRHRGIDNSINKPPYSYVKQKHSCILGTQLCITQSRTYRYILRLLHFNKLDFIYI